MNVLREEQGRILCCGCGTPIVPNPSALCVACIRNHIDLSEHIPKQHSLNFCRGCERYLNPPGEWVKAALESRDLLDLCLKRVKGHMQKVRLVDAGFVWTEPHSKRIKVKLTVQGDIGGTGKDATILEQAFLLEYVINHQMCTECHRVEAQDFWRAQVQVRQRGENKKTFLYLEQLILKHRAHSYTLSIKPAPDGVDFLYATESHARKMVDFLMQMLPVNPQCSRPTKKLISHDIHSNVYQYKQTWMIDIVPVSKDSAICLPRKLAQQLGGIGQVCLVYRVTHGLHIIDPQRCQIAEVSASVYYRQPFQSLLIPKQLVQYYVLNIEIIHNENQITFPGQGQISNKHSLADVWVVRMSDLGNDTCQIHTRTHLGNILKVGDTALGYNLVDANVNDDNYDKLNSKPDVILVKKYYDRSERTRRRVWKLKHLTEEVIEQNDPNNKDYNDFLDDIEEDVDMRQNINIYKDKKKQQIPIDSNDIDENDENCPQITLEEMLDDLIIDDNEIDMDDLEEVV